MNQIDTSAVSDRMLRTFLAAAQHGSFSAAARAVGVGQPAVSHAVTGLERALGVDVFERTTTGVTLTPAGQQLHDAIALPYLSIDRAVHDLQFQAPDAAVTLSVSSSLASFWLMPRLPSFKREHPDVELRVLTTDADTGVGRDDADVWIPLGSAVPLGLDAAQFCVERVVPVATPEVTDKLGDWSDQESLAEALAAAPLLSLEERYESRFDWHRWFALTGRTIAPGPQGYTSNDYSLVVQAALDGQGVALGWFHIVADLVADGRLIALGEPVETNSPFQILTRADVALSPAADALRHWLQAEMSAQMH